MKTSFRFLAILLLTLALSGCATGACKKKVAETPAPAAKAVAAPVEPEVMQEPASVAPVTPAESEDEQVPAAKRKYVNK